ncbi:: VPEP [Gemmata massiliana]|uniref:: VPEP n=1 Tax=Gemmata massiliana TaxID=1210884 RepID=A0A6P2DL61_9BACT|nr:PEP-CTERM sorting domain-containing protein [Gemmata massiliana]VTS01473.1 : VPEP [Gemmata massiliana]
MRPLLAALITAACAVPAVAGPIDSIQYRTSLRTNLTPGSGPTHLPGETAYTLPAVLPIGVVASGVPDWTSADPAYPAAGFSVAPLGGFTPFTPERFTDTFPVIEGGGRFALDVDLRDQQGQVGHVTVTGAFTSTWDGDRAFIGLALDGPEVTSFWLGHNRYDMRLGYGWAPQYQQREDGQREEVWNAVDPIPVRDGPYWVESVGGFYASLTPTATPEPGTLLLAGVGLGGLFVGRRLRRLHLG